MSEINVQISVSNLTQIDQHQNDQHRLPMVHHDQNTEIGQQEIQKKLSMPVEPDEIEKKNINQHKNKNKNASDKRRKQKINQNPGNVAKKRKTIKSDHLIDYQA